MQSRYLHIHLQGTTRNTATLHFKECKWSRLRYKETRELWKDIASNDLVIVAFSGEAHTDYLPYVTAPGN
jgi:hypothetical protein